MDAPAPQPRFVIEFTSAEALYAYHAARTGDGPAEGPRKVLVNSLPQSIKLRGSMGDDDGEPVLVIEVLSRAEEGDDLIAVAPGSRTVI